MTWRRVGGTLKTQSQDIANDQQLSLLDVHLLWDHLNQLLIPGHGNCSCDLKYDHSMRDNRCNLLRSLFKKMKAHKQHSRLIMMVEDVRKLLERE